MIPKTPATQDETFFETNMSETLIALHQKLHEAQIVVPRMIKQRSEALGEIASEEQMM